MYDNVNRDCLWFKLQNLGVKGRFLSAIKSLYEDVKCSVRINDMLTPWFTVTKGVKQECVISPTLFSTYVNDLAEELKCLNCGIDIDGVILAVLLFADDVAILAPTAEAMQRMLDVVDAWCRRWRLSLNQGKTKIVHYRPPSFPQSDYFYVEIVSQYKYLGLWLDEHLTMDTAVTELAKSASRALGVLISKFLLLVEWIIKCSHHCMRF